MSKLGAALRSRWFFALIGVALLALLVWFAGPLIAVAEVRPLGGWIVRLIVVAVLFLLWAAALLVARLRAHRTDEQMAAAIADSGPEAGARASDEEVAELRARLQDALSTLKRAKLGGKGGRQYLYQLPWYVIIGPPGAGKTTALVNSGLRFPLSEAGGGAGAVRGVGGTRHCDWWFTDEAVLIDTAGRYTTQDSDQAVDKAGWLGFLGMLRKYRPRQPINGALVAIALTDLIALPEAERQAHARAVRQRLRELHDALGVRIPVYVLFTKADLVAGFVEFFDDLDRDAREQVWGMTLPLDDGKAEGGAVAAFGPEYDRLLDRLNARLLERMQQESDVARRSLVFTFPMQMASMKEAASDFLTEIFKPSRLEARPLLRGVYFTSGTQEGTPLDRIMGALAQTFGVERARLTAVSGGGRSYFLTRLLREVVFREADVVGANAKVERRRVWVQRGAAAAALIVVVVMGAAWFMSYAGNRGLIRGVEAAVDTYRQQIAPIDGAVADTDFAAIVPPLDTLRLMPAGYAARDAEVPTTMRLGLYQGPKLQVRDEVAYRHALNTVLLPRLVLRIEDWIRANLGRPDAVYEGLKVYLMLGGQGPLDPALVKAWMDLDWQASYPGEANAALRQALAGHLDALLSMPMGEIPLDGNLIEQARRVINATPMAERVYAAIRQDPAVRALPEWRPVDHAGAAAARAFTRRSGKPLSEGIPGLYTFDGFHDVFLPRAEQAAERVAEQSWVLGPEADISVDPAAADRLANDVEGLYYDDYAAQWDGLLSDIVIVPFESLSHTAEVLNVLSGPNSPLRNLLQAVAEETKLTAPVAGEAVATAAAGIQEVVTDEVRENIPMGLSLDLANVLGDTVAAVDTGPPPGKFVEDRFAALHALVEPDNNGATALDEVIRNLEALYREVQRAAGGSGTSLVDVVGTGSEPVQELMIEASRLPAPVGDWVTTVVQGSSDLTVGGARSELNDRYLADLLPLCRQATENRYPFTAGSGDDVALADFTRLFAPGGLFDQFFQAHLGPFVDTSAPTWRSRRVENVDFGLSEAALTQFQKAAAIRDAFFSGGGGPSVRFELTPVTLDAASSQVLLELGDTIVTYGHGPTRPTQVEWPSRTSQARVSFTPPTQGQASSITRDGPWALFRLLDDARIGGSSLSDRFDATFEAAGRNATFELRAGSVVNPFTMPELRQFRCPASL